MYSGEFGQHREEVTPGQYVAEEVGKALQQLAVNPHAFMAEILRLMYVHSTENEVAMKKALEEAMEAYIKQHADFILQPFSPGEIDLILAEEPESMSGLVSVITVSPVVINRRPFEIHGDSVIEKVGERREKLNTAFF
jgi:hypothetical protein